ncbi:glycosyltransferase [Coraliomargarita algicola]|uniref:Glycosyltransferase n=1 Tax=Coraliomargarita algicola TaxID=3092156 RepID=A0ABZ0RQI7_9BACT|nr:glycosyltransferase [Coraliomargarita sp. J2-16]WPJ97373.1 glycosyltransferase [Coraliomargarita sp. J2-16]
MSTKIKLKILVLGQAPLSKTLNRERFFLELLSHSYDNVVYHSVEIHKGIILRSYRKICRMLEKDVDLLRIPYNERNNVNQIIAEEAPDCILSLSSLITGRISNFRQVVTWADAVFSNIIGLYDNYKKLDPLSLAFGHQLERRAIQRSQIFATTSTWSSQIAQSTYCKKMNKVNIATIPRCAILPTLPEYTQRHFEDKETLNLLLITSDWERKGGDYVLNLSKLLISNGIEHRLHIIGDCPTHIEKKPHITGYGYLNKSDPNDWKLWMSIMNMIHYSLLFSFADFTPNTIYESYAFGVPVMANRIGATPEMVVDSRSGYLIQNIDNMNQLITQLEPLLLERKQWAEQSSYCRKLYETRYSDSALLENLQNAIIECTKTV